MSELTILIAEDDKGLADLWQSAFERAGYAVIHVDNGQAAIDWLRANPLPDVLIVDYNMPLANGIVVLRELGKLDGGDAVTTVMVTANHVVEIDAIQAKIDMFLQKPVGFHDMQTLVERFTQQNRT